MPEEQELDPTHAVMTMGKHRLFHDGHLEMFNHSERVAGELNTDKIFHFISNKQDNSARIPASQRLSLLRKYLPKRMRGRVMLPSGDAKLGLFGAVQTMVENDKDIRKLTIVSGPDRFDQYTKMAERLKNLFGFDEVNINMVPEKSTEEGGTIRSSELESRLKSGDINAVHDMISKTVPDRKERNKLINIYRQYHPVENQEENTEKPVNEWFVASEFHKFIENEKAITEAAKYLRPDLYLVRKRKTGKLEVVVRPDPVDDVVEKGGEGEPKPSLTDVKAAISKGIFKQTPTSIKIFGDLSDEMKKSKSKDKKQKPASGSVKGAGAGAKDDAVDDHLDFDQGDAENAVAAMNTRQAAFTPTEDAIGMDSVEYPGPTKPIPNGKGTQFEFAVLYAALRSSGFSEASLLQRNEMSNGRLFAFSKDVFEIAKRTAKLIPEECRQNMMHSTEAGIRGNPEPKTDLICGDTRISLKLDGDVQLSSEQSITAANTINMIAGSAFERDVDFNVEQMQKLIGKLKKLPPKMIDPNNLDRAIQQHTGKPWFDQMVKNGKIKDEFNWQKIKDSVVQPMVEEIGKYLEENEDFKRALVFESLTGTLAFGQQNPQAVASHVLSPNGMYEIGNEDGDFISSLMDKVKVGVRAKSRSDRITNATVRIDLKGSKVKIAEASEVETTQDEDILITPEKLKQFYIQNPEQFFQEVMRFMSVSLSGNIEALPEEDYVNIVTIRGKKIKIPVTGDTPEPEMMTDIDEAFMSIMEQDDPSKRDYKREYRLFHGKPEQRAKRSKRVLARRKLMKQGKVRKGDGKDVDHKDGNALNNGKGNLRVQPKSVNRARNKHRKGEKAGKIEEHAGFEGTDELLKTYIKQTPFLKIKFKAKGKKYKEPN